MQQSYSNWFVSWICSISKLDVIKSMLGFGVWYHNLAKIVVCVGAHEITKGCNSPLLLFWNNFIKLLNRFIIATIVNTCYSLLGWYLWCHLMNVWRYDWFHVHKLFYYNWCWMSASACCVASMIGAFIGSFPICYIYYLSYICANFVIDWCTTWFNSFLKLLTFLKSIGSKKVFALFFNINLDWLCLIVIN
jgi:hypothetical protein